MRMLSIRKNRRTRIISFIISILVCVNGLHLIGYASSTVSFWIEGENCNTKSSGLAIIGENNNVSAGKTLRLNSSTGTVLPSGGFNSTYEFSIEEAGNYDIWIRSSSENVYAAPFSISIDSKNTNAEVVVDEGWINPMNSGSTLYPTAWSKANVDLTASAHTLKWSVNQPGAQKYLSMIDAIAIVPSNVLFAPISGNIVATQIDFELCTLLYGYDLDNIDADITLPISTAKGYDVTWASNNESAISALGHITKSAITQTAILSASVTVDGTEYTKEFNVTILGEEALSTIWIEGENFSSKNSSNLADIGENDKVYGSKTIRLNTQAAPSSEGYVLSYNFSIGEKAIYDIWIRSSSNSEYASPFTLYVDGQEISKQLVIDEEWINPMNSGTTLYPTGWSKSTIELDAAPHILKWVVTESGSQKYFSLLDAVAIIPANANFMPVASNIKATLMDFDLSSMLMGYDLNGVDENLSLPDITPKGHSVTWSSNNENIIDTTGKITQGEKNASAELTASIVVDSVEYTKKYEVNVLRFSKYKVKEFRITDEDGQEVESFSSNDSLTATAKVKYLINTGSNCAIMLFAQYGANSAIKSYDIAINKNLNADDFTEMTANIILNNVEEGDYIKAYLWENASNCVAIAKPIKVN